MRDRRLTAPGISKPLLNAFLCYIAWFLRRNFHAVRVSRFGRAPDVSGLPAIFCLNHPGWWDPLIALTLAYRLYPERLHYGPIEAAALGRYKFFERLGFFGIEPGTSAGAVRFLRVGESILNMSNTGLWVTAQGTFVDPRVRPTEIRGGIGHLLRRLPEVAVVPVAIEFPFWEERRPEALARFGEPLIIRDGKSLTAKQWTCRIARSLQSAQDALAEETLSRNTKAFEILLGGKEGMGGLYDVWRTLRARMRGERFRRAHGPERL